jgi:hypothetical protein
MTRAKLGLGLLAVAAGCLSLIGLQQIPQWSVGEVARAAYAVFQAHPWLYWSLGFYVLAALLAQVTLPLVLTGRATFFSSHGDSVEYAAQELRWTHRWVKALTSRTLFVVLTVLTVLVWRLPGLAPLKEFNPDESEDIALALALRADPRWWISADGGTHGPLAAFVLLPVQAFGMSLDYASARLVGLGLLLGSIFFLLGALRAFFPEYVCRAVLLPLTVCLAFLINNEYVAYNAEHPTVFILCAGAYGCARLAAGAIAGLRWRALATGLVLGLLPFTKLQGVPVGLVLAAIALVVLLVRLREQGRRRWAAVLALCAGGVFPAVLVALYLWQQGLFSHFWTAYINANLAYTSDTGMSLSKKFEYALDFFQQERQRQDFDELFLPYFRNTTVAGLVLLVLVYTGGLIGLSSHRGRSRWPLLLAAGAALVASVYIVMATGFVLGHYLFFLLFPLAFLAAVVLATLYEKLNWAGRLALLAVCLGSVAVPAARAIDRGRQRLATKFEESEPVAEVLRQFAAPGESLVVWGWMDRYYVLTGLRPGTRYCEIGHFINLADSPGRDYFYQLYLKQFDEAKPPVFVDAVFPGAFILEDPKQFAHEMFPEMRQRIATHYVRLGDFDGPRVYVAKERLATLPPTREIPVPIKPLAVHDMAWKDGRGHAADAGAFLVFPLPKPQWITAMRLDIAYEAAGSPAEWRLDWKRRDQPDFVPEQQVRVAGAPGPGQQTLIFPVKDTVDQIRIHPDCKAGGFAIKQMSVQAPLLPISEKEEYQELLAQVKEAARTKVPKGAIVLVISKGDEDLLRLPGRTGWHFPQDRDGSPLGYNPDEAEAIAILEALRKKGAQFLLVPEPYVWWLEEYQQFRQHLERHYHLVARQDNYYYLYDLRSLGSDKGVGPE